MFTLGAPVFSENTVIVSPISVNFAASAGFDISEIPNESWPQARITEA